MQEALQKVPKSKRQLILALESLIKEKPFNQITITELVELAGVSRGTFYYNYKSIQAVLADYVRLNSIEIMKEIFMNAPFASHHAFFNTCLDVVAKWRDFYQLISRQEKTEFFINLFAKEVFPLYQKESRYDRIYFEAMVHAFLTIILYYANNPTQVDKEQIIKRLVNFTEKTVPDSMIMVGTSVDVIPEEFSKFMGNN